MHTFHLSGLEASPFKIIYFPTLMNTNSILLKMMAKIQRIGQPL